MPKTPITYYGGKQLLASRITAMIPPHRIYCEPFFGGGAVFFAKNPSRIEVINDINDRLITFYTQCQTNFDELSVLVKNSLHSESMHRYAKDVYHHRTLATDVEMAWAVWMVTSGSFAGSTHGGWKWCNGTSGSHSGVGSRSRRDMFNEALKNRLSTTQISCRPALDVIRQRDSANTLFYLDPPYPSANQGHYGGYTMVDFSELLEVLCRIKGRFILSNYWSQTLRYHVAVNDWKVDKITMPLKTANFNGGKGKRTKTEILVRNFEIEKNLFDK